MWELSGITSHGGLFFLLFMRSLGVFFLAPAFGGRYMPVQVRAGLALGLTAFALPAVVASGAGVPSGLVSFALGCLGEFATGATLGFMANLIFVSLQVAGQLIDMEMGFGIVSALDLERGGQAPVMGTFLHLLALVLFLEMGGHHSVLGGYWESLRLIPAGTFAFGKGIGDLAVATFGGMFLVALKMSLPVGAALFLATLGLGVIARTVPQINVFIVGLPLKVLMGSVMMWLALPLYVRLAGRLVEDLPVFLMRVLAAWKG
jgi:flagellar biosynthetic protein FliR